MKGLIIIVLLSLSISTVQDLEYFHNHMCAEKTYCQGWEDGYCEGWKDVKGKYVLCPNTPLCPLPEIDKTTYTDGYNRGFKQGSKDAKK